MICMRIGENKIATIATPEDTQVIGKCCPHSRISSAVAIRALVKF